MSTREEKWNTRFNQLKEFHSVHGHTDVAEGNCKHNRSLYQWVWKQGQLARKGKLPSHRKDLLEEIDFNFGPEKARQKKWNKKFKQLKEFKSVHGHTNATADNCKHNPSLYQWVSTQRKLARKGKLPSHRKDLLEGIDFKFDSVHLEEAWQEKWNQKFKQLKEFKSVHGHTNATADNCKHNPSLSIWVSTQRKLARKGKLPSHRKDLLEEIDFNFDPQRPQREFGPWRKPPKQRKPKLSKSRKEPSRQIISYFDNNDEAIMEKAKFEDSIMQSEERKELILKLSTMEPPVSCPANSKHKKKVKTKDCVKSTPNGTNVLESTVSLQDDEFGDKQMKIATVLGLTPREMDVLTCQVIAETLYMLCYMTPGEKYALCGGGAGVMRVNVCRCGVHLKDWMLTDLILKRLKHAKLDGFLKLNIYYTDGSIHGDGVDGNKRLMAKLGLGSLRFQTGGRRNPQETVCNINQVEPSLVTVLAGRSWLNYGNSMPKYPGSNIKHQAQSNQDDLAVTFIHDLSKASGKSGGDCFVKFTEVLASATSDYLRAHPTLLDNKVSDYGKQMLHILFHNIVINTGVPKTWPPVPPPVPGPGPLPPGPGPVPVPVPAPAPAPTPVPVPPIPVPTPFPWKPETFWDIVIEKVESLPCDEGESLVAMVNGSQVFTFPPSNHKKLLEKRRAIAQTAVQLVEIMDGVGDEAIPDHALQELLCTDDVDVPLMSMLPNCKRQMRDRPLPTQKRRKAMKSMTAAEQTSMPPLFQTSMPPLFQTSMPPLLQTSMPPLRQTSMPPMLQTSMPPLLQTSMPPL